jgi:uncharacterized protein (TIGR03118 family)
MQVIFPVLYKESDMLNNRFSNISLSLLITVLSLVATRILYADQNFHQKGYLVHNLVSDVPGEADHTDPDLVNAWGIAFNPDGVVWVNDGGTGKATLYNGEGIKQGLVVTIPGPSKGEPSKPTGIVFFGGNSDFIVKDHPADPNDKGAPSRFIFATENGTIAGWAPTEGTQPPPSTMAIEVVNNAAEKAIYKGLALSADGDRYLLYAADFHNARVDVFDGKFQPVSLDAEAFTDPKIPDGFAPFGIQAINGVIFVTYAKQDDDKEDDVAGPGLGYVNAYDASGHLLQRFAGGDKLNAPWGLALAPADFGKFSNHLLVGNFGDGAIIAYDLNKHFHHQGTRLRQTNGHPIYIDGLWGISFGNGLKKQATNALFFAAGPNEEAHGLYGKIEAVSDHSHDNDEDD